VMAGCGEGDQRQCGIDTAAPLSVALGHRRARKGAVIRAHAVEKHAAAHCIYARARWLGGGLVDGLPGCGASRCSEVRCAPLGTEWLGFGITAVHRWCSGGAAWHRWAAALGDHTATREGTR
jgi:hypothetical protein